MTLSTLNAAAVSSSLVAMGVVVAVAFYRLSLVQARLSALSGATTDAVLWVNSHGRILCCNEAASRLFGRTAADMAGRTLSLLLAHTGPRSDDQCVLSDLQLHVPLGERHCVDTQGAEFPAFI